MRFVLWHRPDGAETAGGTRVVYDVGRDEAFFGSARVDGPVLVWELGGDARRRPALRRDRARPVARVARPLRSRRLPPGGVAYRHTHPGPGIRCLLRGTIRIETEGRTTTYGPLESWFESGPEPVLAEASATEQTAFVRVMVLPREWEGRRTIAYVDPADAEKPKTQRASILLERAIELP